MTPPLKNPGYAPTNVNIKNLKQTRMGSGRADFLKHTTPLFLRFSKFLSFWLILPRIYYSPYHDSSCMMYTFIFSPSSSCLPDSLRFHDSLPILPFLSFPSYSIPSFLRSHDSLPPYLPDSDFLLFDTGAQMN